MGRACQNFFTLIWNIPLRKCGQSPPGSAGRAHPLVRRPIPSADEMFHTRRAARRSAGAVTAPLRGHKLSLPSKESLLPRRIYPRYPGTFCSGGDHEPTALLVRLLPTAGPGVRRARRHQAPSLFSDNMVLQRSQPICLGLAAPGESHRHPGGQASQAPTPTASGWSSSRPCRPGPLTMTVAGKNTVTVKNDPGRRGVDRASRSNMQFGVQSAQAPFTWLGGVKSVAQEIAVQLPQHPHVHGAEIPSPWGRRPRSGALGGVRPADRRRFLGRGLLLRPRLVERGPHPGGAHPRLLRRDPGRRAWTDEATSKPPAARSTPISSSSTRVPATLRSGPYATRCPPARTTA